MSKEINGAITTNPNLINIFNPIIEDDDIMITEDSFYMGTEDDALMETEDSL